MPYKDKGICLLAHFKDTIWPNVWIFLYPFLGKKSLSSSQRRTSSLYDPQRDGADQTEGLFNEILSEHTTEPSRLSPEKSRRCSLFRGKKRMSLSVQDLHQLDHQHVSRISPSHKSKLISLLNKHCDDCLSKSVQNMNMVGVNLPTNTRLACIKKLGKMSSTSDIYMARITENNCVADNCYEQVAPCRRPLIILPDDAKHRLTRKCVFAFNNCHTRSDLCRD